MEGSKAGFVSFYEALRRRYPELPQRRYSSRGSTGVLYRVLLLPVSTGAAIAHALHLPHEYIYHRKSAGLGRFTLLESGSHDGSGYMNFEVMVRGKPRLYSVTFDGPFDFAMRDLESHLELIRFQFIPVDESSHIMCVEMHPIAHYLPKNPLVWLVPKTVSRWACDIVYKEVVREDIEFLSHLSRNDSWKVYFTDPDARRGPMFSIMREYVDQYGPKLDAIINEGYRVFQSLDVPSVQLEDCVPPDLRKLYSAYKDATSDLIQP